MEVDINQEQLLLMINRIKRVAKNHTPSPILGHCLLDASESGALSISATDLVSHVKTSDDYDDTKVTDPGRTTVSARTLHDIVQKLPKQETIKLRLDDGGRLIIACGRSRFDLETASADDFPDFPSVLGPAFAYDKKETLVRMINQTVFAASKDQTREILSGVLMQFAPSKTERRFVATDAHRIAVSKNFSSNPIDEIREAIIPRKAIMEVKRLLDEESIGIVRTSLGDSWIMFAMYDWRNLRKPKLTLMAKLIGGAYPNYQKVIPTGNDKTVTVKRTALLAAVRRMLVLSPKLSRGIRLQVEKNAIFLDAKKSEHGNARDSLEAIYNGEPVSIGLNARYLKQVLKVMSGDNVRLKMKDNETQVLIGDPDDQYYTYCLMPIRI
ncbi:MAG: DNA polymerase III subunit beta [Magnetococcales bacterium]|nr:DNA polymerase III subunit beta [Magnetococcales bacterium]